MPLKLYSTVDVSQHNTATDCWMIIDGFVYDVTGFLKDHPGGSKVCLTHAHVENMNFLHILHLNATVSLSLFDRSLSITQEQMRLLDSMKFTATTQMRPPK